MLKLVSNFFEFIFPPICVICGKLNKNWICENCRNRLKIYEKFTLIKNKNNIEKFLGTNNICFDEIFYCYEYKGLVRKLLLQYKFKGKSYICNMFAKMLLNCKKTYSIFKFYDIIIPVPMEKQKVLIRGYNQTVLITDILAKNTSIIDGKLFVKKVKNTKTQSMLSAEERKENIKDAFVVNNKNIVYEKNIIIFDDICTTGATSNEISKVLKQAGAKKILVLVIAKD